jgi:hypothetical protein
MSEFTPPPVWAGCPEWLLPAVTAELGRAQTVGLSVANRDLGIYEVTVRVLVRGPEKSQVGNSRPDPHAEDVTDDPA